MAASSDRVVGAAQLERRSPRVRRRRREVARTCVASGAANCSAFASSNTTFLSADSGVSRLTEFLLRGQLFMLPLNLADLSAHVPYAPSRHVRASATGVDRKDTARTKQPIDRLIRVARVVLADLTRL